MIDDVSCDWRRLTLGLASLLAQQPAPARDPLADVARQLEGPVAVLRAHAAALERATQVGTVESVRGSAARTAQQADLVAAWVSAVMDLERIRLSKAPLQKGPLNIAAIAAQSVCTCGSACARVHLRNDSDATATIQGDASQLTRAFECLLRFAARRQPGSDLEVSVMTDASSALDVRVAIAVRTTGATRGVEAINVDDALDLDLCLARSILSLHGGEVETDAAGAMVRLPQTRPPRPVA